ncbi:MtrAB system histidine kinase MtrB [Streptomonospora nanhaiensis]|uniref:Sensor histidine kinase MtrB n=1 Tax=Streptomonospora nanhaiensis TaxID=1323731 RepID=A0A853BLH0_9ACTN|nr:MtrAB system histidine kinase MtrB [Streptomonospora nanhaiensis]MBV2362099.1 HAMP domain-containing histidine kinase [Streptomonospora nanhaiensis]MBX9391753.1 HAMP domain-containing histidine kinase [Streptomonospora nanhaiensis]NYI96073.1 two-component system sensor histidine kinase MtrB [Streptomonospora nanhaiensis]
MSGGGVDAAGPPEGAVAARSPLHRLAGLPVRCYLTAQRAARALVRGVHHRWRRSLQLRVVTTTLLISALVTAVLGFFLVQQVLTGLLEAKREAALNDHKAGLTTAINMMQDGDQSADQDGQVAEITAELANHSGATGLYEVVILPDIGGLSGYATVDEASVPQRLRDEVGQSLELEKQYVTFTEIIRGDTRQPGLAVGARLSNSYELYYLFPLDHEQQMLDLVQNTVFFVGTALILLLAVIAYVVTRQVVIPVRAAAGSAERLASGDLTERMKVRGEDDLARLAISFNDMAGNLQEKIRELEELSQVQRQFASDVSHELRTPLTTIRMAGDLLYEDRHQLDPTMGRSVELLQSQLERFEELLTDLLEISRHDAGAVTLSLETVDIRDAVLKAVGDAEQIAEKTGIKVVLRLPAEPCVAEFDPRRINRILRNLIVNAIEHSEGRDVIVTAAGDRDAVAVAVRDFGVGLKEGEEHLCFDRFWRADPARARTTGGTGLGLSIAKEDAQLHGGWLQAWGMPGKGSQFRLSLPRRAGAELRGSPLPLAPPEMAIGRARGFSAPMGERTAQTAAGPGEGA